MICIHTENLLTLTEASKTLPGRPHTSTLWRWHTKGVRGGVKLETIVIGGLRYTSSEAIERFVERTTAVADGEPAPQRTTSQRNKAIEKAEQELADAGI